MDIEIGDEVIWLGSSYIVVDKKGDDLKLKQNFSIGTILLNTVKISNVIKK